MLTSLPDNPAECVVMYLDARERHIALSAAALDAEIDRSEWVAQETRRLVAGGMAKTAADKEVHSCEEYFQRRRHVAQVGMQADLADRDAAGLYLAVRLFLTDRIDERISALEAALILKESSDAKADPAVPAGD